MLLGFIRVFLKNSIDLRDSYTIHWVQKNLTSLFLLSSQNLQAKPWLDVKLFRATYHLCCFSRHPLEVKLNFRWQHWRPLAFQFKMYFYKSFLAELCQRLSWIHMRSLPFPEPNDEVSKVHFQTSSTSLSSFLPFWLFTFFFSLLWAECSFCLLASAALTLWVFSSALPGTEFMWPKSWDLCPEGLARLANGTYQRNSWVIME